MDTESQHKEGFVNVVDKRKISPSSKNTQNSSMLIMQGNNSTEMLPDFSKNPSKIIINSKDKTSANNSPA